MLRSWSFLDNNVTTNWLQIKTDRGPQCEVINFKQKLPHEDLSQGGLAKPTPAAAP